MSKKTELKACDKPEMLVAEVLLDLIEQDGLCKSEIVATLKLWKKQGWNRRVK